MTAKTEDARSETLSTFQDLLRKSEASLMPAIEEHVTNEAFDSAKDGLDFLEVKNSLLLSYLIDLTYHARERVSKKHDAQNFRRLMEARTVLDKTRPLEKKMRYQLDKLLAATTTSFAVGTNEDPLTYRPDPRALEGAPNDDSDDDSDSDSEAGDDTRDSDMDDLEAARATLQKARQQGNEQANVDDDDGLYRAPRHASMPYTLDEDTHKEREKRIHQKQRQSELAHTLRAEYGEAPEQADVHGGSEYGRQREAARRMAEREAEKIQVEEDNFMRLTTSRKEKKERNRLMREEGSNLAAIASLGNVVRGVSSAFGEDSDDGDAGIERLTGGRYSNGKRKRSTIDEATGRSRSAGSGRARQPKNEFQQALYGKSDKKSKKKKR